jgi:plasmid maintenance system antidote protein VapI
MEERGATTRDLAQFTNRSIDEVSRLLVGRSQLTEDWAKQLAGFFGASKEFWLRREEQYRLDVERLLPTSRREECVDWLRELPISDMLRFGWIDKDQSNESKLLGCLTFFDVPTVDVWRRRYGEVLQAAAYRTSESFDSIPGAVAAWLRQGEILAREILCQSWDPEAFRSALSDIRALTREADPMVFLPILKDICARCGVAVVVLRSPSGCRASGATMFVKPNKALVQLSVRFLSDDQFWFTFFHEAGHLLLHGGGRFFLEGTEHIDLKAEAEANDFAASTLVPPALQTQMLTLKPTVFAIVRFARKAGVAPGIVVGQLQHLATIQRNHFNQLKKRYVWSDS